VKAECPLCKVAFGSIIHNVRSQDDYDIDNVAPPRPPPSSVSVYRYVFSYFFAYLHWLFDVTCKLSVSMYLFFFFFFFSLRTVRDYTPTHPDFMALVGSYLPASAHGDLRTVFPFNPFIRIPHGPPTYMTRGANPNGTSAFRRSIYERDLWARLQPDITGRYRECSPEFYS